LLTALVLAATVPVYIAPAMNQAMWHKPVTQANIARLKDYGFHLIDPAQGEQACGEEGLGRMSEPADIGRLFGQESKEGADLAGYKILITAGPTREYFDPVRFISNRSSGKMGYALMQAALDAGAEVVLVSGPVALTVPGNVKVIAVETAAQMYEAVMNHAQACDIYIGAAAVADYSPVELAPEKIKKSQDSITVTLQKTRDILAAVAALEKRPFTVGFAAETQHLDAYANAKLTGKHLDMIAANRVGGIEGGFDSERNELVVFWHGGKKNLPMAAKTEIASDLMALIAAQVAGRHNPFPKPI
jgi:phosphopantothenoylcysteine decarboxylase/phosphopantothenate--cysteine ligase